MIDFETTVRVERPVEEVFAFVSNPLLLPRWNSAVRAVRGTSAGMGEQGSTCLMERQLPQGRVENDLEIIDRKCPSEFGIRTTSGPTPFVYRYRFEAETGSTTITLSAEVELPGIAPLLGPLAARAVKRGVDANFATLKAILEGTGGN
jgi:ligand-binding SRPBCC domain-containing protein